MAEVEAKPKEEADTKAEGGINTKELAETNKLIVAEGATTQVEEENHKIPTSKRDVCAIDVAKSDTSKETAGHLTKRLNDIEMKGLSLNKYKTVIIWN
jgi:hypothetical protein